MVRCNFTPVADIILWDKMKVAYLNINFESSGIFFEGGAVPICNLKREQLYQTIVQFNSAPFVEIIFWGKINVDYGKIKSVSSLIFVGGWGRSDV